MNNKKGQYLLICILFFLLILLITLSLIGSYYGQKKACKDFGGNLTGCFDCRVNNEFYSIYPKSEFSLMTYVVNKNPKTEGCSR